MQPHIIQALNEWYTAWNVHERAARDAFTAAFPALRHSDARCQCYGPTLRWERPGEGAGKVCLDDHGRATIEFEGLPQAAVGAALDETFGPGWFDEGEGGIAAAEPGTYSYEDESTYAEYEIDVHPDGTTSIAISYVKIDDIVVILDQLETALAAHRVT